MLLFVTLASAAPAYELLRQRDPVTCADLGEATVGLRDELLGLARPDTLPALVSVRAAACLAERFGADPVAHGQFATWMSGADSGGFALMVLSRVEHLPPPVVAALLARGALSPNRRVRARALQLSLKAAEAASVPAPSSSSPAAPTP